MIDLHCHLLPGVDDGARTMEDALTLAEAAVANGVKASVLTPHVYPGVFDNRLSTLRPVYEEYRDALARAGIALDVHLGGEVHLHPDAFELLEADDLPMIGGMDGLKVMLLEFPDGSIPPGSDVACRMFADQGIRWLIAHPERNKAVTARPDHHQALPRHGLHAAADGRVGNRCVWPGGGADGQCAAHARLGARGGQRCAQSGAPSAADARGP